MIKTHKNKLLMVLFILAVLVLSYIGGGNYIKPQTGELPPSESGAGNYLKNNTDHLADQAPDLSLIEDQTAANLSPASKPPQENNLPPSTVPDAAKGGSDKVLEAEEYTCTISVRCDTLLSHMDKLAANKKELVPADGIILPPTTAVFYPGENIGNILQRELKKHRIHFEFTRTPIYNSIYIEGINNLYEFDCGELSGWEYRVNGWFPNYGCSRYQIEQGDVIEILYTCDLGKDIGGYNIINDE